MKIRKIVLGGIIGAALYTGAADAALYTNVITPEPRITNTQWQRAVLPRNYFQNKFRDLTLELKVEGWTEDIGHRMIETDTFYTKRCSLYYYYQKIPAQKEYAALVKFLKHAAMRKFGQETVDAERCFKYAEAICAENRLTNIVYIIFQADINGARNILWRATERGY